MEDGGVRMMPVCSGFAQMENRRDEGTNHSREGGKRHWKMV